MFDVDLFARFVKRVAGLGVPVIAEVLMLHSAMGARMLKRVGGVNIPDRVIERIEKAPVKFDESAKILLETVDQRGTFVPESTSFPLDGKTRSVGSFRRSSEQSLNDVAEGREVTRLVSARGPYLRDVSSIGLDGP